MGTKFEGVDILDFLGQVVELHTQHYKEDFDVDKELIQKVALSGEPEERRLLWMSRPCGTYCLSEREVYLQESNENKVCDRKVGEEAFVLIKDDVELKASITELLGAL